MTEAARNVLINYLPDEFDEHQMSELFSSMGQIEKVKLIKDPHTNMSRCYGFVLYANPEDALRAIKEMSGYEVQGKKLRVAYAQPNMVPGGVSPNMNVFFSDFEDLLTNDQIKALASNHGGVQECKILEYEKHPRGVAFIRYNTVAEAEDCVAALNGHEISTAEKTVKLVVKYAERKKVKQSMLEKQRERQANFQIRYPQYQAFMTPTNRVFVHGITGKTEREVLDVVYPLFSGNEPNIEKVDVPCNPEGEPKNYCFVHYANPDDARRALNLNGHIYNGKQLQVRYK